VGRKYFCICATNQFNHS